MKKIVTSKLKILDMHCSACAMNIDFQLEDLEGVMSSKTSYAKQELTVSYDSEKISLEKIIKEINKLNYQVKLS